MYNELQSDEQIETLMKNIQWAIWVNISVTKECQINHYPTESRT